MLCLEFDWLIILSNERHLRLLEPTENTLIFLDERGVLEKHFSKLAGLNMIRMKDKEVIKIEPIGIKELQPEQLKLKFDEVLGSKCLN